MVNFTLFPIFPINIRHVFLSFGFVNFRVLQLSFLVHFWLTPSSVNDQRRNNQTSLNQQRQRINQQYRQFHLRLTNQLRINKIWFNLSSHRKLVFILCFALSISFELFYMMDIEFVVRNFSSNHVKHLDYNFINADVINSENVLVVILLIVLREKVSVSIQFDGTHFMK